MKTSIIILFVLFIFMLLSFGQVSISFKPFSVSIPYWYRAVGFVLVIAGILIYNIGEHHAGYKKGLKDGVELVIKYSKKKISNE